MKILERKKIAPTTILPHDSITLEYNGKALLTHMPKKTMTVTELIVFEADEALRAELGINEAIGGMFIEASK